MRLLGRLLAYLKYEKWRFVTGMILLAYTTLAMQGSPLIMQYILDQLLTPLAQGMGLDRGRLFLALGVYMALVASSSLVGYVATRLLMDMGNRIAERLRNEAFDHLQGLPISYFDDKPAGNIATRIVNDTETIQTQFFTSLVSQVFFNGLITIVIYVIMFSLNLYLGLFLLILLPFMILWQKFYAKKTSESSNAFYDAQGILNTQVTETMNGSSILQLYQQEERMEGEFDKISSTMFQAQKGMVIAEAAYAWTLVEALQRIVIALMLAFLGYQVLGGVTGLTAGLIFSSVTYTERLFNVIGMIVRMFPNMQRALSTSRRVFELMDQPLEEDQEAAFEMGAGRVVFDHVSFGYKEGQTVLKDINLVAEPGQTVALVGHTGSGKSSMINLLFRFYDPQEGAITIDGQKIKDFNRESIRKEMGIVLQDPYLFSGTIASNIAMDKEEIRREDMTAAMKAVGAGFMLDKFPAGLDEPVIEKGNSFSSGERQLISFARTLAANPKILILDEATSHIDTETEEVIQKAMEVVKEGRTPFIIAHRLSTIQSADQILVLDKGQIVERGNHESLIAQDGLYANMYRLQSRKH